MNLEATFGEGERLVGATSQSKDGEVETGSLRPRTLGDYIGQGDLKRKLGIFLQAARERQEALDHAILSGPPGLGKTTLAHIIASELGSSLHTLSGPTVEKKGDLAAILTNLQPHDVLFIDEIHRLPKPIEEVLYSAMEDFKLDIIIGQGPSAKTIRLDLPKFTLVGATTRSGLLSQPLRDRFGIQLRLEFYPASEIEEIVRRSSKIMGIKIVDGAAKEIACRSRGTPRIANRLLRRVRDYSQVKVGFGELNALVARDGLSMLGVDLKGLDSLDKQYLLALISKYDGGPVGVDTLCALLGEERDTLEEVCEPFLLQEGFIQRTPRGRVATRLAYEHLGIEQVQPTLTVP